MAKVFWHADGGCHSGFARVTHNIGERLVRDYGHEVHVLAINHRGDDFPSVLDPSVKTPLWLYRPDTFKGGDTYGYTRIIEMLARVEPDVVVEYNDPNILLHLFYENQYDPNRILLQYRPILAYVPCDGTNLPPEWQRLTSITNMVSMSEYGRSMYPGSKMVYHGVDTDQFWPVSEKPIKTSTGIVCRTKKDCKEAFGFDRQGFLVLRIDKNSGRKDFPATFKALVPVMERHSDIQVHFHTVGNGGLSGVDINKLITRAPNVKRDRWFLPDLHDSWTGWSQEDLNCLVNAADVVVSTSRGEGFGLTLAEALACAVPVIAQNVSAIPEVVGPGGRLIEPQRLITVPSGEDLWLADIEAFTDAIEYLYESAGARRALGEAGVEHVRKNFRWDVAAERFDKYITALASEAQEPRDDDVIVPDAVPEGDG
jgi:glycosyltransferase involved in cell wall biosynthesis